MLRGSAEQTNRSVELRAITDRGIDSGIPGGAELLDLVDATISGDETAANRSRDAVVQTLGPAALVDAAGVIGNFEMMNRIADATGMPVGMGSRRRNADVIEALGLDAIDHID